MISAYHFRDGSHGLLAHWQRFRLVGECNVGRVQVIISCESGKMMVFDMQDAPGLTIECSQSAMTFFLCGGTTAEIYLEVTIQRQMDRCHLKHVGYARCIKNEGSEMWGCQESKAEGEGKCKHAVRT
jgi:hypothetical protein